MEFNEDVAGWVYETISKMDDDSARMFGLQVAHDLWHADMEGNERLLRSRQEVYDSAATQTVAKHLLEHLEAGGDPNEAVAIAASVAIAKSSDHWKYQERNSGRFGRMTGAEYRAAKRKIKADSALSAAQQKGSLRELRFNTMAGAADGVNSAGSRGMAAARTFGSDWDKANGAESRSTQTFGRIEAGGKLVQQLGMSTQRPGVAVAGAVANYAGQFGPEAEKVVGPTMRKTAYRYRGTERTPDKALTNLAETEAQAVLREQGRDKGTFRQVVNTPNGKKVVEVPRKTAAAALTPEESAYATERAAVNYFMGGTRVDGQTTPSRLPRNDLAELHRKSGRITPSEGILIDSKGQVVAQAVGFGEDHYLPFNLKNLSKLKGGSYVRTRESGGITSEDIYTGLMSGARSMTVVSHSGVFTVDFSDDLRGGRRYNDKARAMTQRYQQTLDAVQSEQVGRSPISRREKAEIRAEVEQEIEQLGLSADEYTPAQVNAYVNQRILERRETPQLTKTEYDSLERDSWRGLNKQHPEDVKAQKRVFSQMERQALAAKGANNYKLDGEGYKAALDALQEQFPYFIAGVRVQANREDPEAFTDGTDQGYVKPRFVRPTAAMAGYYGEGIGQKKVSAERTGYQNYRARGTATEATESATEEKAPERVASPQQARGEAAYQSEVKAAEAQRDQTTVTAAQWWQQGLAAGGGNPYAETQVLNKLSQAQDKDAFIKENGDEVRSAISFLERKHPEAASTPNAPKVLYNPPKRKEGPEGLKGTLRPLETVKSRIPDFNVEVHGERLRKYLVPGKNELDPKVLAVGVDGLMELADAFRAAGDIDGAEDMIAAAAYTKTRSEQVKRHVAERIQQGTLS